MSIFQNIKRSSPIVVLCLTTVLLMYIYHFQITTSTPVFVYQRRLPGEIREKVPPQFGYVLATDYFDQMTGASVNILSLQCWAGAISERLMVVEPFVNGGSSFGITLSSHLPAEKAKQAEVELRLRDVLNMDSWKEQIRSRDYAPFKSWKAFMESAPKNLIVVGKPCGKYDTKNCNDHFYRSTSLFAKNYSFSEVRFVQLKYKLYSFGEFRDLIYGDNMPHQSVVVFHQWGGIVENLEESHIAISEFPRCYRDFLFNFLFENSLKIVEDSKRYLDRYMPKGDYISVMLRVEQLLLPYNTEEGTTHEQKMSLIRECVNGIVNEVRTMKKLHKNTGLFLTVDCLKHGSNTFIESFGPMYNNKGLVNDTMELLFSEFHSLGMELSFEEWKASFDYVSSFQTPGYVALLQKHLAASGTCLVTAGSGHFQQSAIALHKSIHKSKNISSHCHTRIHQC